jgi:hypothetical protein
MWRLRWGKWLCHRSVVSSFHHYSVLHPQRFEVCDSLDQAARYEICLEVWGVIVHLLSKDSFHYWPRKRIVRYVTPVTEFLIIHGWRKRIPGLIVQETNSVYLKIQKTTHTQSSHSWSWALLEKPPVVQLLKNLHQHFMEHEGSLPCSQEPLCWSLSWSRSIESIPSHSISLR